MTLYHLNDVLAGTAIGDWLRVITTDLVNRDEIAWNLIQITFSSYHIHGIFMTEEKYAIYFQVIKCYNNQIFNRLGEKFFVYLYHFVIGKYGHLNESESYKTDIEVAIRKINSGENHTLSISPDPARTAIPYPGLVFTDESGTTLIFRGE